MQWQEPTNIYKEDIYRKFIRTPVVWDEKLEAVNLEATYDNPRDLFPNSYVDYIEILYGKEKDTTTSKIRFSKKLNKRGKLPAMGVLKVFPTFFIFTHENGFPQSQMS